MRLFIGIELPEEIKNQIRDYLEPIKLSEKGWERPHDYHQTLLFIGSAAEEDLQIIKCRLDTLTFNPFRIEIADFQFFPRRVMYLGFRESPELLSLKSKIDQLFPEWLRPGSRPFLPHVTVKRWQRYEYDHLEKSLMSLPFKRKTFEVKHVSLFLSEKDLENNKYHVIYSSPSN